ncbi:MAG: cupredoxin domain-containing protein [Actinomycetota bacterium]
MRSALAAAALCLLLPACQERAQATEQRVVMTLEHSRFEPSALTVSAGTTVRFVVRNTDPIDHELIVGSRSVQRKHETGTERHHGAKPGEISVPAGRTRVTTYRFEEPGVVLMGCHLPGHYDYGMRGRVRVQP